MFRPNRYGRQSAVWWLDYGLRGRRFRESAHTTSKRDAQRLLRQRLGERESGRLTGAPDKVTFADLRAGLERHYELEGNRSAQRAGQALDHLEEFVGSTRRALEITQDLVNKYLEHRIAESAARATACYEARILGAAFGVAVDTHLLATRPRFKLPRLENARQGFFGEADFAALVLELPETVRPVVEFLHATGWRLGEALGLMWDAVDWEGQVLRLAPRETKGRDARIFPFGAAPGLKALLEARWAARDGLFVFHRYGRPIRTFRRTWTRACARAGLAGRLVHDLRRSAARDFRRRGASEGEIMKLCGWKTRAMFDRYDIIDEADLAAAVAKRFGEANGKVTARSEAPAAPAAPLSSSAA